MESLSKNVYIEDQYPGVTLGVIIQPRGLVQIDAPPSPEDGRSWRAALMNLGGGPERLLINMDAHPDRTLGVRAMDCTVVAHEQAAQVFRNRPSSFKAQMDESGSEWETIPGLGGLRWTPPEISFNDSLTLHWEGTPILLEHHPGPSTGAIWALLPEERIVFVGDAVLKNQPPFLATADMPAWQETLNHLGSKAYREFTIISGRSGVITPAVIKNQAAFLKDAQKKLDRLSRRKKPADAIENLAQSLLSSFRFPATLQKQYLQRLRYGLQSYYSRHYNASLKNPHGED
jgi:glyoxylase-like metal-dependent hydrolase (beta-lactamase superfamily II)